MNKALENWAHAVWAKRGAVSTALLPLSWLYGRIAAQKRARQQASAWRAPVPVVVIGNILPGGTGKTPVTLALCRYLQEHGWRPGIVSRGYGTKIGAQARLSSQRADSAWLGDEPALLAAASGAPLAVHPQRVLAAQALLSHHAEVDVILADDGLQHYRLAADISILVQDARALGNGRLLPAGPLREPASRLQECDWIITNLAPGQTREPLAGLDPERQVIMRLAPDTVEHLQSATRLSWQQWRARPEAKACSSALGIGQPERFYAMLQASGQALNARLELADHAALGPGDLAKLPDQAILITNKDAVKLRAQPGRSQQPDARLWVVHARAQFAPPDWLARLEQQLILLRAPRQAAQNPP